MAITIHGATSRGAEGLTTIMNHHQTEMGKSIERVSTGLRINHAGDDSAGNAISEKMMTQIRALDQSQDNTQDANALLNIADGAVTSMVEIIQKMRSKALEAAQGSLTSDEREVLQNEMDQLKESAEGMAFVTQNGRHILTGTFGAIDEAVTYGSEATNDFGKIFTDGTKNEETKLAFSNISWSKENPSRAMNFQVGPESGDVITTHLMDMSKIFKDVSIDVSSVENSVNTAKSLETALTRALFQQTEIGVIQERLEFTSANLQTQSDDNTEALSTIRDADLAKEMTNYVKNNVLMQATQSMMAQANTTLASFINLINGSQV